METLQNVEIQKNKKKEVQEYSPPLEAQAVAETSNPQPLAQKVKLPVQKDIYIVGKAGNRIKVPYELAVVYAIKLQNGDQRIKAVEGI